MDVKVKAIDDIIGRNKRRDFIICNDYISGLSPEEIIKERNLSISVKRVNRILFQNQKYLNPRIAWPKSRRVWLWQKLIKDAGTSKKDKADLLAELRKELEGDNPLVQLENHTHYVYKWSEGNNDKLLSDEVPERGTRLEEKV